MPKNRIPEAWLYLRLSRDHSGAADSLDAQEQKLRQRAEAEGLNVTKVLSEGAGKSAYGGKTRPVWEDLVATVTPGVVVLAVETSRFSRDTADGLTQLRTITDSGAHVVTLDGNDTRQAGNALPLTVRLAVAQEESKNKSDRIRRRKADQRRRGIWTNKPPYGHVRREDGKLELDPTTAPVVRRIAHEAIAGIGATVIARGLNEDGIPGPRGGQWNQMTIAALLRSPVLCGWQPAHGDKSAHEVVNGAPVVVVEGPTILSVAERQQLRNAVSARSPRKRHGKRVGGRPPKSLLQGVLHCGQCGALMASTGKQYVCSAARSGKVCGPTGGTSATVALVDSAAGARVLSHLAALEPDDDTLVNVAERWMPTTDESAQADAQAELAATQERLEGLEHAHYVDGTVPAERFTPLHQALTARTEALTKAVATLRPHVDVGPLLDLVNSREAWDEASPALKRELLAAAVESVSLEPAPYRGARWSDERLTLVWAS